MLVNFIAMVILMVLCLFVYCLYCYLLKLFLWSTDQVADLEVQLKQYRKLEEISLGEGVGTGSLPSDSVASETLLIEHKPTRTELMQLGSQAEIGRLQG